MGLSGLILDSWFAKEWAIKRERSGWPIGACSCSYHSYFSSFLLVSLFLLFPYLLFSFSFFSLGILSLLFRVVVYCAHLWPFILPLWQGLPFLPINYYWPIVGVLLGLPTGLSVTQPPPLPCVFRTMPHSLTKVVFVLFLYFPWHSHPNKGWVSLLPTSIACI